MPGSDEYDSALFEIEEAYRQALRAFAKYFRETWKATPAEWEKAFEGPVPSDDWFSGFNAGVDSIDGALDTFLEEFYH